MVFVKKAGVRSDTEAEEMGEPSGSLAAMTLVASTPAWRSQRGFTLVELLVVISITSVLLTLSASALRNYWLTQALKGSTEQLVSQLRQLQQRTDAESHPVVYGARFEVGTPNWATVRYDPKSATTTTDDECTLVATPSFSDGVNVSAADFDPPAGLDVSKCPSPAQDFTFFYARGTATQGAVTLTHSTTGRSETVSVLPLTGRVRRS
jgi:prepilin-type N-terminal cleavage/methylation domain-containing protein